MQLNPSEISELIRTKIQNLDLVAMVTCKVCIFGRDLHSDIATSRIEFLVFTCQRPGAASHLHDPLNGRRDQRKELRVVLLVSWRLLHVCLH